MKANKQNTAVTVTMNRDKDCKGSVRFATTDEQAAVTNVYVSRALPGVNDAKQVRVTVEVLN
jgi:hypothetical protein